MEEREEKKEKKKKNAVPFLMSMYGCSYLIPTLLPPYQSCDMSCDSHDLTWNTVTIAVTPINFLEHTLCTRRDWRSPVQVYWSTDPLMSMAKFPKTITSDMFDALTSALLSLEKTILFLYTEIVHTLLKWSTDYKIRG